ncbi:MULTISPECIES: carbohydrate ABC transporter permease [unclassified Paenibacillus]|uniref:carbohydrate ABC transporter permease n=1 Tax=unclassified Paenibacillus TaxID=185978 RepID=UPI0008BA2D6C|nr:MULTISPECIES: carbohydrate ABC transporter permease [unclassified Paenibacillus]QLG40539.1 carbohydrate ABC transporter permease [Paenibacillus sp. E222]SEN68502.1 carbohydrate ABC transporter membrane protein 2, CUT1 family [Paenibacillus sp. OK076]
MMESRGEKVFYVFNYIILGLFACLTLYPFLYVLSASISSPQAVVTGEVLLLPKGITWEAYTSVLGEKGIWTGYGNTIFYTVVGTLTSMILTICGAYPLAKKRLKGRTTINLIISFTLIFNAGMIPMYLNFQSLGLLDNRFGIIIGFAISTFNFVILRTFFQSLPEEIEEAARIDGAGDIGVMMRIVLPLSKAPLATIGLFYAVSRWNGYFWSMIMLRDESKFPLQVLLNRLVVQMKPSENMMNDVSFTTGETVIYATIVVAIIPIIAVYPFIQKYFVKGVMIGSLKG